MADTMRQVIIAGGLAFYGSVGWRWEYDGNVVEFSVRWWAEIPTEQ